MIVTVQELFEEVEEGESFWVATREGEGEQQLQYVKELKEISPHKYLFEDHVLRAPFHKVSLGQLDPKYRRRTITACDFAEEAILGLDDGSILYCTEEKVKEISHAHLEDITQVVVFPSKKVLLTIGLDLSLKIWPFYSDQAVREMYGPTKTVTDVQLIGHGRNFVVTSKDGAAYMFETGSGTVVRKFELVRKFNQVDEANCCAIMTKRAHEVTQFELEFETADKLLFVGYESGIIQQFDMLQHLPPEKYITNSAVNCMQVVGEHLITGHQNGELNVWHQGKVVLTKKFPCIISMVVDNCDRNSIVAAVYAGPEDLIMGHDHLVGLPEMFKVVSLKMSNSLIVTTQDSVAQYK